MRQEILGVISAYEIFARSMGNYSGSNNNGSMAFDSFDGSGSGNGSGGSGNGSGGNGSGGSGNGSGGSSDDKGITYTVQPGDTLSEIGAAYGVPWQTIYKKNKDIINDPNLIFPGQVLKFDSGGYTGEWGSYGKLAVLHEKELVLNAHDTENLLTSLTVLDSIMASLELQSQQMQYSSLMSPNYGGASSEVLEQKVHIEASFPNVSSHGEIEEALNNLIN
jgi:hypothetical protein